MQLDGGIQCDPRSVTRAFNISGVLTTFRQKATRTGVENNCCYSIAAIYRDLRRPRVVARTIAK